MVLEIKVWVLEVLISPALTVSVALSADRRKTHMHLGGLLFFSSSVYSFPCIFIVCILLDLHLSIYYLDTLTNGIFKISNYFFFNFW